MLDLAESMSRRSVRADSLSVEAMKSGVQGPGPGGETKLFRARRSVRLPVYGISNLRT